MSSPSSPLGSLGGGPGEGPFRPGMLNLDVTPPLGAVPCVYRDDVASVGKPSALAPGIAEDTHNFAGPFQQELQPAPPLISEANPVCPLQTPYLERRQLVFGGGGEEIQDSREVYSYEGQPLGSEGEPQVLSKTRFDRKRAHPVLYTCSITVLFAVVLLLNFCSKGRRKLEAYLPRPLAAYRTINKTLILPLPC